MHMKEGLGFSKSLISLCWSTSSSNHLIFFFFFCEKHIEFSYCDSWYHNINLFSSFGFLKIHSLSSNGLKEGRYAAIVHYYQPKHSSFESQVKVTSDRAVEGSIKFHYCPHASGCRSVIKDLAGSPFFDIERKTVALEFEIPMNSSTWIVSFWTVCMPVKL